MATTLKESVEHMVNNHRTPANTAVNALEDVRKDRPDPTSATQTMAGAKGVAAKLATAKAQFRDCAVCQAMTTAAEPVEG